VKSFPAVFYAGMFGFKEKPYFTAVPGAEVPPKVDFSAPAKPAAQPH
jgi:LemA protein